jgi:hypothetical protein
MASVRISWCFHAIIDTSEVSKIQCAAVQEYGGKGIEDRLETVWQFESCQNKEQDDCVPKNEGSGSVSHGVYGVSFCAISSWFHAVVTGIGSESDLLTCFCHEFFVEVHQNTFLSLARFVCLFRHI